MEEYGGYLSLELPRKKEYFCEISESKIVRLNLGRSAFWYAAKNINPSKIYVPYLNCPDSTDPFIKEEIEIEYYRLTDDLTPMDVNPKEGEAILWVNYYGNATENQIATVVDKYKSRNLIIDNCHAFFSKPLDGVYNCYSARKFFGVCDGAYLIADNLGDIALSSSYSYDKINYLLKATELGTNSAYPESLLHEAELTRGGEKSMSLLTRRILESIDYNEVRSIRKKNMLRLHGFLEAYNEFPVNLRSETHMFYPLMVKTNGLRERIIAKQIYMPTLWRHVPEYFNEDVLETNLTRYMLLLPIDQRYTEHNMDKLAEIILDELKK